MTSEKLYGLCNGDILDQDDLWYLVRVPEYGQWQSWVVHGCKKEPPHDSSGGFHHELGYFVRVNRDNPTCMGCGLVAPNKFKTLWTLHNWEPLQSYIQAGGRRD